MQRLTRYLTILVVCLCVYFGLALVLIIAGPHFEADALCDVEKGLNDKEAIHAKILSYGQSMIPMRILILGGPLLFALVASLLSLREARKCQK